MRMNRIILVVLLCFAGVNTAIPQPPDTLWTYTYAGPYDDEASAIVPVVGGGFLIGGKTRSSASYYPLLIRLDANGREQWTHTYSYLGNINAIASFPDGGWALASGEPVFCRMKVVRTDSAGNVQWERCINEGVYGEEAVGIAVTSDGGMLALSEGGWSAAPDIDLVRLSADGDSLWAQTYGGSAEDHGGAALTMEDGGFFIAGSQNHQAWVFITDSAGNMLWNSAFGDPTLTERLWAACETPTGDYAVAGMWQGSIGYHPFAACVAPYGDTLWTRYFPYLGYGSFRSITVLPDGNILIGGGNAEGSDDGYLAVLLTAGGDTIWTVRYNTPITDAGRTLCLAPDSGFAMAGYQGTIAGNSKNIWVLRTASLLSKGVTPFAPISNFQLLVNYPNPFNATTVLQFAVPRTSRVMIRAYDVLGREVGTISDAVYSTGEHSIPWRCPDCASGVYWVQMSGDGF